MIVRWPLFFFDDTATPDFYALSLHDALPIFEWLRQHTSRNRQPVWQTVRGNRSEEHTSELQSHSDLVCRLLLEKKKLQQTDQMIELNTLSALMALVYRALYVHPGIQVYPYHN